MSESKTLLEIRIYIDENYSDKGPGTETPMPPEAAPQAEAEVPPVSTLGPRISFDEDSVDMGKVPPSGPMSYAFHFRNVGSEPLNILGTNSKALIGC